MPTRDFGAVCDISVLESRESLKQAGELFDSSGLYIPNSTYSWLSRSKLIEVRKRAVKHSLLKQVVEERRLFPIHLPDLYEELGRQIMFRTNHKVALTDLRGLLLSAHLQLPLLVFSRDLVERISKRIGTLELRSIEAHASWLNVRDALDLYRELSFQTRNQLHGCLEDGCDLNGIEEKMQEVCRERINSTEESIAETSKGQSNPGKLKFSYIFWNIFPDIREYSKQEVYQPGIIRKICERSVVLLAEPQGTGV